MLWACWRLVHRPRLGSLAPSLGDTGLAAPFSGQQVGCTSYPIWYPKQRDFMWNHQQEINLSLPGFLSSSAWNRLPPLLSEAQLRQWIFEDRFWFQLENQKAVAP